MFAARQIFLGRRAKAAAPTARSYVQDGLIAMWDGIENAGWGVHDANAQNWTALVGGVDAVTMTGKLGWSDRAAVFSGNSTYLRINSLFGKLQSLTIEVCHKAMPLSGSGYGALFSCLESGGVGIQQNANFTRWYMQAGAPTNGTYYGGRPLEAVDEFQTVSISLGNEFSTYKNAQQFGTTVTGQGVRYNNYYAYYQIGRDPGDAGNIKGDVYCVRLYSRALTAAEIAANYAIDKERFNLP